MKEVQALLNNRVAAGLVGAELPKHSSGLVIAPAGYRVSRRLSYNGEESILRGTDVALNTSLGGIFVVDVGRERETKQPTKPLLLVNDFGDNRSTVECEQRIHAVFSQKGLTYEAPHSVEDVERFKISDGAYNVYQHVNTAQKDEIPSVFVGVVDPGVGSDRRGVVITTEEGHTFVGPDNGLFWPAIQYNGLHIKEAYLLDPESFKESSVTFHGRDQFSPVGARIATGQEPWEIDGLEKIDAETLVKYEFKNGQVVEKDGYPNIKLWPEGLPLNEDEEPPTHIRITNPKRFDPKWTDAANELGIDLRVEYTEDGDSIIIPVVPTFESVKINEPLCYVGSSGKGLPELAIRNGEGENGMGNRMNVDIGDVLSAEWIYGPVPQDMTVGVPVSV